MPVVVPAGTGMSFRWIIKPSSFVELSSQVNRRALSDNFAIDIEDGAFGICTFGIVVVVVVAAAVVVVEGVATEFNGGVTKSADDGAQSYPKVREYSLDVYPCKFNPMPSIPAQLLFTESPIHFA